MTLSTLIVSFAVVGAVLTVLMKLNTDRVNNIGLSFLQNFCGAWFIFSGWVKAVDPLGTAYKMEQYFAQFESTFAETWLSFIAPMFPFLTEYQNGFSVFMIILEILLGIALIIGFRPKLTAWVFFIIMFFFTFLTGFTHLTGYVPTDANFFDFGSWGKFQEAQMRVTDCGCFGDFLKLKPYTSFLKDIGLMIPAFIFILASGSFHRMKTSFSWAVSAGTALVLMLFLLVSLGVFDWRFIIPIVLFGGGALVLAGLKEEIGRGASLILGTILLFIYSISHFSWNLPNVDFRPFKEGENIREAKAAQEEAMANTKILNYIVTNKESGQTLVVPYEQYLKEFRKYPKEEWELEQEVSEPAIPINKISEFEVADSDGNDITEDILNQEGYSFMIVAYKIKDTRSTQTKVVQDSVFVADTLQTETGKDTIVNVFQGMNAREVSETVYTFQDDYLKKWTSIVAPVAEAGAAEGVRVYGITSPSDPTKLENFRTAAGLSFPMYTADDILLKTIIRSNPGLVLLKDGKILKKWHYKQLPSWSEIKSEYFGG